ncbi:hypothetical protein GN109_15760 [Collimonas pratensis]|uniref:RDD family protein n=1 Tax=Collimonas pratensis TaxID=279113 RepID=UPI0009EF5AED|nr:RDD family protein [Collimonas pratensis]NKI70880.1 hypothetical protein [Collimonas pratensis]
MTNETELLEPSPASFHIAGFWRRLAAFVIDILLLGVVGYCLGLFFSDFFIDIGAWGRGIGFVIALYYFGVMDSAIFGGRTIGKRLMHLRVVTSGGGLLGFGKSLLRAAIVCIPYFLNGLPFSTEILQPGLILALSVVMFGLGLTLIYFFIFNRKTRQSLPDLLVGSIVVKADALHPISFSGKPWRGHYAVAGLIAAAACVTPFFTGSLAQTEPFSSLIPLQKALANQPGVASASVNSGQQWHASLKDKGRTQKYLQARITTKNQDSDFEAMAMRLAGIILADYPAISDEDVVSVSISRGYDIGISSMWRTRYFALSPAQWRQRLGEKSNLPS